MVDFRTRMKEQLVEGNVQSALNAIKEANIKLDELRTKVTNCDTDGLLMAVDDVIEALEYAYEPANDVKEVDKRRGE